MSKKEPDDIQMLNEWQEHQLNPGYWVNRFSIFFPAKRTVGLWIIALIEFFMIVPTFIISSLIYLFIDRDPSYVPLIVILGFFSIFATLRAFRLKPDFEEKQKGNTHKPSHKEKKKKLPKRRKDYK